MPAPMPAAPFKKPLLFKSTFSSIMGSVEVVSGFGFFDFLINFLPIVFKILPPTYPTLPPVAYPSPPSPALSAPPPPLPPLLLMLKLHH
jgi:hypothetical protein